MKGVGALWTARSAGPALVALALLGGATALLSGVTFNAGVQAATPLPLPLAAVSPAIMATAIAMLTAPRMGALEVLACRYLGWHLAVLDVVLTATGSLVLFLSVPNLGGEFTPAAAVRDLMAFTGLTRLLAVGRASSVGAAVPLGIIMITVFTGRQDHGIGWLWSWCVTPMENRTVLIVCIALYAVGMARQLMPSPLRVSSRPGPA